MKVIRLSISGISPAKPEAIKAVNGEKYLAFVHGERGRGREEVRIPLGARDFPADVEVPVGQEYALIKTKRGNNMLISGKPDGAFMVLWSLDPGFRGGAEYRIEGSGEEVARGYEAQGEAGRMGGAACPVVVVTGPCRLSWHRSGRLYGSSPDWVAMYDGQRWTVGPAEEIESLEDIFGEGESDEK